MRAILIDPRLRRIQDIEIADDNGTADLRRLIGSDNLDHGSISDVGDTIWCYGFALCGGPIFAFRFRNERRGIKTDPFGGICIITGHDRAGETCPPHIPIAMLEQDIEWLDEIQPEVTVVQERGSKYGREMAIIKHVVTYSRVKK